MKKQLFSVVCFLMLCIGMQGQTNIANYTLAKSMGTYTPLVGATTFTTAWDDNVSAAIPLGGTFTYGATSYTACYISSNGFITFGAAPSTTNYTPISTLGSTTGAIAAFARDGGNSTASGATPSISYMNVGGATGEFVVQFTDHATYANRSTERLSFQIRLNLSTGAINIIYSPTTAPGSTNAAAQIGLRGNTVTWTTNVNSLYAADVPTGTSCTWNDAVTSNANSATVYHSSTNSAIAPSNGLTFTWAPPAAAVAPVRAFGAVSGITQTAANLSWTAASGATQYNVQYRVPGTCAWTNFSGNPVTTNSVALTGLTQSTNYQVRVQSSDGTNNAIWSHIPDAAGSGDGYSSTGTFKTLDPLCAFPTAQPTNLVFGSVSNTSVAATFSASTPTVTNYLVVATLGTAPNTPTNGVTYPTGTSAALNGTVVSVGTGTTISSTGLTGNTNYTYYIYAYNSTSGSCTPAYLVSSPLTGTVTTCPAKPTAVTSASVTTSGFNLSWTAPAGGNAAPITYSVEVSTNSGYTAPIPGSPFIVTAPTTSLALTGLNPSTTYNYRITAHNGCNIGATTSAAVTTSAIATDLQAVQLQAPAVNAAGCYGFSIPVVIQIKNAGTAVLDFSTNNATVVASITGTNPQTFTNTISTGTLAAGATQNVTVTTTYNMNAAGNYTVNATATLATPDANPSNDAMTAAVRTTAAPTPIPYFEDFSAATTPTGWTNSSSWLFATNHAVTNSGMYKNMYSTATTATMSLMKLGTVTGSESFAFDFRVLNYNSTYPGTQVPPTGNWGTFKIQASADCGATYTDIGVIDNTTHTVTTQAWTTKSYPLASFAGKNVAIRFVAAWVAGDYYLDVDNVNLSTCFPPTAITNTNTTSLGTDLTWIAPTAGSPANYIWEIRTSGAAGSGATGLVTTGTVTAPSTSVSATGLSATTAYSVYVRSDCGSSNNSVWGAKTFTTPAACPVPTTPTVTTITASSAVATWTAGATETQWDVYYGASPLTAPAATTAPTATVSGTPSYTMSPLNQTTGYAVYVRANCGSGALSNWTSVRSFTTPVSCPAPTNVVISAQTPTSAVTSWTAGAAETSWIVRYSAPTTTATASGTPSYTMTGLTPSTGYSVQVRAFCAVGDTSTWTVVKTFTTQCLPANITSTTPGTRCGIGTTTLGATGDPGATLSWYAASTGGTAIGTGSVFTTPSITNTTTYYVEANNGLNENVGRPSPTVTTGYVGTSIGHVFNATANLTIQSAVIYPIGTGSVTICLQNSSGTELAVTGSIPVTGTGLSTPVTIPLNFNVAPGTGYRLLLKTYSGITDLLRESSAGGYPYTSTSGAMSITNGYISGTLSTSTYYTFYNIIISTGCPSTRVPVAANVTNPPALTLTGTTTACANAITTVSVTSAASNYDSYSWSPVANLYTDPAATTPYTGGSASVLYYTSATAGSTGYTVTANNSSTGCANIASTMMNTSIPVIVATASPSVICSGSSATLSATPNAVNTGTVAFGSGATTSSSSPSSPFNGAYGGMKAQYILRASDLIAAGVTAGNITSLGVNITSAGSTLKDFAISMGTTTLTAFGAASDIQTGVSPVYSTASFVPVVGNNVFTFSTPFNWNGTSNILVSTCWSNNNTSNTSSTVKANVMPYTAAQSWLRDSQTSAFVCALTGTVSTGGGSTSTTMPQFIIGGQIMAPSTNAYTWQWNPGALTGSTVTVTPVNSSTTTPTTVNYTVTGTETVSGCTGTTVVTVTVNPMPTVPVATNASQCGFGVSTASVSGGSTYKWYATPTSTTVLQSGTSPNYTTAINATTTWYVSSYNATCESARAAVTATVTQPDAVTASATSTAVCPAQSFTLSAVSSGTNNNAYSYTWTATPATGSGIATSITGASVAVTPAATGTYTYMVTASDGVCATTSSVSVVTNTLPVIMASASPSVICSGAAVTLSATTNMNTAGSKTVGTNASADYTGGPYREGYGSDNKAQYLFTAAELTAAGIAPGNITSLSFSVTTLGSGTMTNFTIRMGATSSTTLGATYNTAPLAVVYGPASYAAVAGANVHTFSTPFNWDGVSNVIVQVCHDALSSTSSAVARQSISNRTAYTNATGACTSTSGTSVAYRPVITFAGQVAGQGAGTYAWQWNPGAANGNTVTVNPVNSSTTTATTANYTVTGTDPATTCSNTAVVSVTVNPVPAVPVAVNSTQCGLAIPTASVSGGATYKWYATPTSTTVLQAGASATYTAAINATTTWYVSSYNATCESARAALTASVTAPDAVTATSSATAICPGQSFTLTAASSGTNNNVYSYTWTATPATGSGMATSVTGATTSVMPTAPGNYAYLVTAVDGVCTTTASVNVLINTPPVIVASASPSVVCSGTPVNLNAVASLVAAGTATVGTQSSTNYIGGPYRGGSGSDDKAQWLFTAAELNAAGIYAGNITSMSFNNTTTGSVALANFTIRMGTTTSTSLTSAYDAAPPIVVGPMTYTAVNGVNTHTFAPFYWNGTSNIVIQACHDANSSLSMNVDMATISNRTLYSSTTGACAQATGTSASYRPVIRFGAQVGTQSAGSNVWQWNPGAINSNTAVVTPTASTTSYPSYTVTAMDPATTCSNSAVVTLTVNPVPTVTVAASTSSLCSGSNATLTAGGATTYAWMPAGGSASVTTVSPAATTVYTVTGTTAGCSDTKTISLAVTPTPTVAASASPSVICAGATLTLTANGATTYSWMPGSASSASLTVTPSATTVYTVTGANSSCTATRTLNVTVNDVPTLTVTSNPASGVLCSAGATATLTAAGTSTAYAWTSGPNTASSVVSPTATTVYTVTGTNSCGTKTMTTTITVATTPTIAASTSASLICVGSSAVLTASATPGVAYSWTPGGSSAPSITVSPSGTLTYTVTGTNACGTATATIVQSVSPCTGIEEVDGGVAISIYPNPANDQVSISIPASLSAEHTVVEITDALGKLVMKEQLSRELTTLKVSQLEEGVYFFRVITNKQTVKVGKVVKQ